MCGLSFVVSVDTDFDGHLGPHIFPYYSEKHFILIRPWCYMTHIICKHSYACYSPFQHIFDDVVTYEGLYGYFVFLLRLFQFHMLYFSDVTMHFWLRLWFNWHVLTVGDDKFHFAYYDSMYSGLLVRLTLECCLVGTCVSWSP